MDVQQNKIAYVTGTSRGIGKALAEKLLANNYEVFGLSRNNSITHPNFTFIQIDISNLEALEKFNFQSHPSDVLLVNNAGIIGEIGSVGQLKSEDIIKVITTNVLAPQILTNKFINKYADSNHQYHILNISSGAGKSPIDGWATYCSSKAAIDLFAETVKTELKTRNMSNWYVHSIAPGVVDTEMQAQIRKSDPEMFPSVQRFRDYKENDDLFKPDWVAEKLYEVIDDPEKFPKNLISVRDY